MSPWSMLLDSRTGIVTSAEEFGNPPEWPAAFRLVTGTVAAVGLDRPWHVDRFSTGTAFGSAEQASISALGEAIERYSANFVPDDLLSATWTQLRDRGIAAVRPGALCLYSKEQYATAGFPCRPFTDDLTVRWVQGRDMCTGEPVMVPASVVYVNFHIGSRVTEPVTNFVVYAGVAAGRDRAHAELAAMEEVIERDAVELWWDSGEPAQGVRLPEDLWRRMTACADPVLRYSVLRIPGPWAVPVLAVAVHDPVLDIVALGTAARPEPADAVLKAAGEAVSLRSLAKGLLDPDSGPWQAAAHGMLDIGSLKPWRADRRYLDDYAPDFRDVDDLLCQTQIHLDPRTRPWTEHLFRAGTDLPLGEIAVVDGDPAEHYRTELLRVGGHPPVSVDLTTCDVAEAGLSVVRVTAPGTYTNAPAGFAARDSRRRSNRNYRPIPHT